MLKIVADKAQNAGHIDILPSFVTQYAAIFSTNPLGQGDFLQLLR